MRASELRMPSLAHDAPAAHENAAYLRVRVNPAAAFSGQMYGSAKKAPVGFVGFRHGITATLALERMCMRSKYSGTS